MIDDIYSAKVLALAANLPHLGRLEAPDGSAEKSSRLCGSRVTVDVGLDASGRIDRFAQEVKACALGQASAAILGAGVIGASQEDLELATGAFRSMLKADGPAPAGRFSDLAMLAPVKDYPARHASTLLAFEAALEAVRQAGARTSPAGAA